MIESHKALGVGESAGDRPVDALTAQARARVGAWGFDPGIGDILSADTLEEAYTRNRELKTSGSVEQFLFYAFPIIYKADEKVRNAAREKFFPLIKNLELPDDFLDVYLTMDYYTPSLWLDLKFPNVFTHEDARSLREVTRDFAFEVVRDHLRE